MVRRRLDWFIITVAKINEDDWLDAITIVYKSFMSIPYYKRRFSKSWILRVQATRTDGTNSLPVGKLSLG